MIASNGAVLGNYEPPVNACEHGVKEGWECSICDRPKVCTWCKRPFYGDPLSCGMCDGGPFCSERCRQEHDERQCGITDSIDLPDASRELQTAPADPAVTSDSHM